ncbi:ERCC4 domain [Trinorchestia longiramus]|nr:ERCC4 domain [Trinorchestia longiramus]
MEIPETSTPIKRGRRQTVRYQHANPLFDEWLREWQDQARQADSNMQFIFAKARKSLKKFPLPVYSGDDCKVLRYFGAKLCSMIDKRIRQHEDCHGPINWDEHIRVQKGKVKACRVPKSPALTSSTGRKCQKSALKHPGDTIVDAPDESVLFTLDFGCYDVLLCVDCAETTSKSGKAGVVKELSQMGVRYDIRKLHVGDFAWVARENAPSGKTAREVILPCIVERKRMDDLASSIKDGRCREQKHRLQRCGLDSVIYLVETAGQHKAGLPLSTCHQAVANTAVVDGMLVKWTAGPKETAAYLTLLTRLLHDSYQDKCVSAMRSGRLPSPCPVGSSKLVEFQTFNKSAVKNRQLSVREMLAKHLLQVAGLSVQKVAAIVNEKGSSWSLKSKSRDLKCSSGGSDASENDYSELDGQRVQSGTVSACRAGRSARAELDGQRVQSWTVSACRAGRSARAELDGQRVQSWTVTACRAERSPRAELDGQRVQSWTVSVVGGRCRGGLASQQQQLLQGVHFSQHAQTQASQHR